MPFELHECRLFDIEGRRAGGGAQKDVIALEKRRHAADNVGALLLGSGDLAAGQLHSFFDVPDHVRPHLVAMRRDHVTVGHHKGVGAQNAVDVAGVVQIGASFLDDDAQFLESGRGLGANVSDFLGHFGHAEIAAECDPPRYDRGIDGVEK